MNKHFSLLRQMVLNHIYMNIIIMIQLILNCKKKYTCIGIHSRHLYKLPSRHWTDTISLGLIVQNVIKHLYLHLNQIQAKEMLYIRLYIQVHLFQMMFR